MNIEYILCKNKLVSTLKEEVIVNTRNICTNIHYKYSIMNKAELDEYEKSQKIGWKFLEDISSSNQEVKQVICESLGCMLAPIKPFNKLFIWYGNNYDILLKVVQAIMGELLTNVDIFNINKRFTLSKLYKGIANITDTVDNTQIKDSKIIKQIINNRNIDIEIKSSDSINWTANTQLVICCNNLFNIKNMSNDILSQTVFVPINSNTKVDIDLLYKLLGVSTRLSEDEKNDDALRYIMTKAIIAYREAYNEGQLTETQEHKRILEQFKRKNSNIALFYTNLLYKEEDFFKWINNKTFETVFVEYIKFLNLNTSKKVTISKRAFLVNFNKMLPINIQKKNFSYNGKTVTKYVVNN